MAETSEIVKLGKMISESAVRVERFAIDSVDVGFFGIVLNPESTITALKLKNAIVRAEDGAFASLTLEDFCAEDGLTYTNLGVWLGDQGLALALIGLGNILELWDIVLPASVGVTDEALEQQMIGMGFVKLDVGPESILRK